MQVWLDGGRQYFLFLAAPAVPAVLQLHNHQWIHLRRQRMSLCVIFSGQRLLHYKRKSSGDTVKRTWTKTWGYFPSKLKVEMRAWMPTVSVLLSLLILDIIFFVFLCAVSAFSEMFCLSRLSHSPNETLPLFTQPDTWQAAPWCPWGQLKCPHTETA